MKRIICIITLLFACLTINAQRDIVKDIRTTNNNVTVDHTGFSLSYNMLRGCPDWVAWTITDKTSHGKASRANESFATDPAIAGCSEPSDYAHTGYERGHMCPAADMKWSSKAMTESFYMSNICPQKDGLNAGPWLTLEKFCRWSANRFGKVWVACGPLYAPTEECIPLWFGQTRPVRVPEAFFKVVLKRHTDSSYSAIAFIMENTDSQEPDFKEFTSLARYAVTVEEVEKMTGLMFFPFLPDGSVKKTYDLKHWGIAAKRKR